MPPKLRKKIPVKQCIFIILINKDKDIFLEKRSPTGIWGGLWSTPQLENEANLETWLLTNSISVNKKKLLKKRRHTFSHFHLDYLPIVLHVDNLINNVLETEKVLWYKHYQTKNIGLPAPIKQLFDDIIEE